MEKIKFEQLFKKIEKIDPLLSYHQLVENIYTNNYSYEEISLLINKFNLILSISYPQYLSKKITLPLKDSKYYLEDNAASEKAYIQDYFKITIEEAKLLSNYEFQNKHYAYQENNTDNFKEETKENYKDKQQKVYNDFASEIEKAVNEFKEEAFNKNSVSTKTFKITKDNMLYDQEDNLKNSTIIIKNLTGANTDKKGTDNFQDFVNKVLLDEIKEEDFKPHEEENKKQYNPKEIDNILNEIDQMIGLTEFKKSIRKWVYYQENQIKRQEFGLQTNDLSYHLVFLGDPGTGKTIMARYVGRLAKALGILATDEVIEVDREGLVGEYVGHTARKTAKVIKKAQQKVLLIDEAYSLQSSSEKDFGSEAISTLLKKMEDDRHNFLVILTGYPKAIQNLLSSNQGFQSRFPYRNHLYFDVYTQEELLAITHYQAKLQHYKLANDIENHLANIIAIAKEDQKDNFGNARFIRDLLENAYLNQAQRLHQKVNLTKNDLETLVKEDFTYKNTIKEPKSQLGFR